MTTRRGLHVTVIPDEELQKRVNILQDLAERAEFFNGETFVYADQTFSVTADVVPPGDWRGSIDRVAGKGKPIDPFYKRAKTENDSLVATVNEFVRRRRNSLRKHLKDRKEKE